MVSASRKAFEVSETQFSGGTVNLLTVLQTQQTLFAAENTLVQVRLTKLLVATSLFQALGGGWTPVQIASLNKDRKSQMQLSARRQPSSAPDSEIVSRCSESAGYHGLYGRPALAPSTIMSSAI